jgi:SOS-response transcriptional repressor LexA
MTSLLNILLGTKIITFPQSTSHLELNILTTCSVYATFFGTMINWGHRIKELRESKGYTQQEFAIRAGIKLSHLSRLELGHYKSLKDDMREALARGFDMPPTEFSQYLYGGELPSERIPTPALINELKQRYDASEGIEVPVLGYINAGMPAPAELVDLGNILVCKSELGESIKMRGLFALRVSGDSLVGDDIQDGDIVIVEKEPALIDEKIYIINLEGEFVARHLHQEDGAVVLTSSNGKYARMKVEELEISGRVVLSGNWKKH